MRSRKRQAAREHVADCAAELFIRDGYVSTTTRQVARHAGVAEGTVFNLFGSKAELLLASLRRSVPDSGTAIAWAEQASELPEARVVIAHFCRTGRQVVDVALPLVRVFLEAAAVDSTVAEAWRGQEAFRLEAQKWLLGVLAERGWLRQDRDPEDLARDLWVVSAPEIVVKWMDAGGSAEDYERWWYGLLCTLLIDPRHQ